MDLERQTSDLASLSPFCLHSICQLSPFAGCIGVVKRTFSWLPRRSLIVARPPFELMLALRAVLSGRMSTWLTGPLSLAFLTSVARSGDEAVPGERKRDRFLDIVDLGELSCAISAVPFSSTSHSSYCSLVTQRTIYPYTLHRPMSTAPRGRRTARCIRHPRSRR